MHFADEKNRSQDECLSQVVKLRLLNPVFLPTVRCDREFILGLSEDAGVWPSQRGSWVLPKGIVKEKKFAHLYNHFALSLENERPKKKKPPRIFFSPKTSSSPKTWFLCAEGLKPERHCSDIFQRMDQIKRQFLKMGRKWD